MDHLLALDQGTSSSRSIVFDAQGRVVAMAQQPLTQYFPQPGWVEHDPLEIWRTQLLTARQALERASLSAQQLRALAITNQRETTLLWNRRTGQPLHRALVWQDRRTEVLCQQWQGAGHEASVRVRTGLLIDPYFSASKLRWLLDTVPGARAQANAGELAFGTVDSWLLWQLTGGAVHATDVSNASRTMLYNIHVGAWDETLLAAFDIPASVLPQVQPSAHLFAHSAAEHLGARVPIAAMVGDQQAALAGQAGFAAGMAKNTYGTGCFMLLHTGADAPGSQHRLLTTRAATGDGDEPAFALEGSVFVGGAVVQWLRDGLGLIARSDDVQALAASVSDSGGVMLVPAFTGLGAPHWDAQARGTITGLTRGSTAAHIARAALESVAYQSAELLIAMQADASAHGLAVRELRVDGGASVNNLLMQFQADVLGLPVLRPQVTETTALGAAYLAGLASGLWPDTHTLEALWQVERVFEPQWSRDRADSAMQQWQQAVRQARAR